MLSKARHLLPRSARRRGPAGSGLFDRVRATTFAMLGGTAAFCLVLVALMSQQGVPYLPALPIPGAENGDEAVSGGAAVARIGDPINVRVPAPAGVPAGPDRIPAGNSGGAPVSNGPGSGPSGSDQGGSTPNPGTSPDVGSGDGGQPPTGPPPSTSPPQSSPAANPAPSGSGNGSGQQVASGGNAEADAVSAAGGSGPSPKPVGTATTAAQQAAAPPAAAPPAPAPSSPSAAEEAAAEEAAAAP